MVGYKLNTMMKEFKLKPKRITFGNKTFYKVVSRDVPKTWLGKIFKPWKSISSLYIDINEAKEALESHRLLNKIIYNN